MKPARPTNGFSPCFGILSALAQKSGRTVARKKRGRTKFDVVFWNAGARIFERVACSMERLKDGQVVLTVEVAVSIFPWPLIPSGPFGWYGDVQDILPYGEMGGFQLWGANFLTVIEEEEADWDRLWHSLWAVTLAALSAEGKNLMYQHPVVEFLQAYRNAAGGEFDPNSTSEVALRKCRESSDLDWRYIDAGLQW